MLVGKVEIWEGEAPAILSAVAFPLRAWEFYIWGRRRALFTIGAHTD